MNYETGKLGMSGPEIEAEIAEINASIFAKDEEARMNRVAYAYLKTPQQIHRGQVLAAMQMAISCLCYDPLGGSWPSRSSMFLTEPRVNVSNPKYRCSDEQLNAYKLTHGELDAIFAAQLKRMQSATVVATGVTDEDGFQYRGIKWEK